MEEIRYMISEAAKRVDVEAHVLRYWQKELALPISRNEMGQRYYKESDIELLKKVKQMKDQGFQLKAINMLLANLDKPDSLDTVLEVKPIEEEDKIIYEDKLPEKNEGTSIVTEGQGSNIKELSGAKIDQFKAIMNHIILEALKENNGILSEEISMNVTGGVIREMNYLMRLQEEKEEERYRKFDSTLRDYQKSRLMTAATSERGRKKSKFFKKNKNKVYI